MEKENLVITFYYDGKPVKMKNDFDFISIPRVGEKISFDIPNFFDERTIVKIEHRYSDSPNLNHLVKIFCN